MKILITNDDGVYAPGIVALANAFATQHEVTVVAPDQERSACGRSMTIDKPLSMRKLEIAEYKNCEVYSTSGTPTDCVKLGTFEIMKRDVDLVLSGINLGTNVGTDIAYSGTVNAAMEGSALGYPSIALSQKLTGAGDNMKELYERAAACALQIIGQLEIKVLVDYIYNINFPACINKEVAGIKVCPHGICNYGDDYEKRTDPFGRIYYWPSGKMEESSYNKENGTDIHWLGQGFVTITPLTWNTTATDKIDDAKCRIDKLKLHI
ncbi:MAG: 5'/3'-nucleotidase SurE [Christensenella sp.]|uniref:5'/3'-nucleotidase SurE n=1 Tax=Christensenella sp. TaxID=1935934 RepID=UPI002B1EC45C|nr:5'/3'-nucleotidase SurE [Christensenella sp.]MEA5003861.1 5'/3'-nucleotidase SurE [Christensenella sp.]